MKKLTLALVALLGVLSLPLTAMATPVTWDFASSILQPLQSAWAAVVKGDHFVATSTSAASVFPYSSTTQATISGNTYLTGLSAGAAYIGSGSIVKSTATTTASCSGNASCSTFTVFGTSPVTITASGGTGSGLATTAPISAGNLLTYNSSGSGSAFGVATGTVSAGTGISLDNSTRSVVGGPLQITNSSPLSGLSASYPFSFSNPTLTWSGFSTTTNSGMPQGNLYVGSGGIFQSAASTSIFGYTPVNPATTVTLAGTANQISSSNSAAQALNGNVSATFSLPSHVIFPGNFQATNATTTNATTTGTLYVTGPYATTTKLFANGLTSCSGASNALTWSSGTFGCNTITASGSGVGTIATSSPDLINAIPYSTTANAYPAKLSYSNDFQWDDTNKVLSIATSSGSYSYIKAGQGIELDAGGDGYYVSLIGSNGLTAGSGGGGINLNGGNGSTTATGGYVTIAAGNGSTDTVNGTGNGAYVAIEGGNGGLGGNTSGGDIFILPGVKHNSGANGVFRIRDPSSLNDVIFDTTQLASSNKTLYVPNITGTIGVGVATTSGQLAYWRGDSGLGAIATTTLVAGTNVSFSGGTPVILGSSPVTINATGGGGGSFPFAADSNYGQVVYSTSTPTLWFKSGLFASSTSRFESATYSSRIGIASSTPSAYLSIGGDRGSTEDFIKVGSTTGVASLRYTHEGALYAFDQDFTNPTYPANDSCGFFFLTGSDSIRAGCDSAGKWFGANIGNISAAFGNATKASGQYSLALGNGSIASGPQSVAAGDSGVIASGVSSMAVGTGVTAAGDGAVAFGSFSSAPGTDSFASGLRNVAGINNSSGQFAASIAGSDNTATGDYSAILAGSTNTVSGTESVAIGGEYNTVSGSNSLAFGKNNTITGNNAIVLGYGPSSGSPLTNGAAGSIYLGTNSNIPTLIVASSTGAGKIGRVSVGSTSPFSAFGIHALNGTTDTTLFAIGSSTASATTTLFSISNTGAITTNLSTGCIQSTAGVLSSTGSSCGGTGGAGVGTVATSSVEAANQVPFFTSTGGYPALLGSVSDFNFDPSIDNLQLATSSNTLNLRTNIAGTVSVSANSAGGSNITLNAHNNNTYLELTDAGLGSDISLNNNISVLAGSSNSYANLDFWDINTSNKHFGFPNVTGTVGVGVATTSGSLAYWRGDSGLGAVATGTVSAGTGISLDSSARSVIGGSLQITNSSPLSNLSASYPFSFSNPTLSWLGFSTTTNSGMSQGNLYIGSGGIPQTAASSSIFGFMPIGWGQATSTSANQIVYTDANGKLVSTASSTLFAPTTPGYVWSYQNGAWGAYATSTGGGGSVTAVTGTWPIISSGGTTPNLTFGGLSTSSPITAGASILYATGVNTIASAATTTLSISGPFVVPASTYVVGLNGAITYTGLATTSQPASSNLLVSNGTSGVYGVATTTVTCSGTVSCTQFAAIGSAPITISGSGGGGTFPFTTTTNFNVTTNATSTALWAQNGLFASSTTAYPTLAVLQSGTGAAATFDGGGVGIGTTSPWAQLSIASTTYRCAIGLCPLLNIATSTDSWGQLITIAATSSTLSVGSQLSGRMYDSGARVGIGTNSTYDYPGLLDQLSVKGRVNTGDWVMVDAANQPVNSTTNATVVYGQLVFIKQTSGFISATGGGSGGLQASRICNDTANACSITTAAAATASAGIFQASVNNSSADTGLFPATSTPVMEVITRISRPQNATTTSFFIGFVGGLAVSTPTINAEGSSGCYFTASSTKANWYAACRSAAGSNVTLVDTGFASSTSITSVGSFYKFRLEMGANVANFYMASSTASFRKVASISTNYPSTKGLLFSIYFFPTAAGLANGLDINRMRLWFLEPSAAY